MDELSIFRKINGCKTVEDLIGVVQAIGIVRGSKNGNLIARIKECYYDESPYKLITISYNIRQQLMYIMYYEGKIHLL